MANDLRDIDRIARTARRKPGNEAILLWNALAIVCWMFLLFFGPVALLDWVSQFGLSVLGILVLSYAIAIIPTLAHFFIARRVVAAAEVQHNDWMRQEKRGREAEVQAQIDALKARVG